MSAAITEFIEARLAEWERLANEAGGLPWLACPSGVLHVAEGGNRQIIPAAGVHQWNADHIARHDPARVLAQVAALREIIGVWLHGELVEGGGWSIAMDLVLRHIAAIWADHEDYDEEWKP